MLADLKTVEDKLYQPDALDAFMNVTFPSTQKHSVHDLIKQLNKATKKETRDRIKYCFSKIGQSHRYKDLLLSCLCQQAGISLMDSDQKKEFGKYVKSEYSEEFFTLLQKKPEDVLIVLQEDKEMLPVLLQLVSCEHGIKLVKLFSSFYEVEKPA